MRLDIAIFIDEIHEFKDADNEKLHGYIRPSMATTDSPDLPASSVVLQTVAWDTTCEAGARVTEIPLSVAVNDAICTFYNQYRGRKAGLDCYGFINLVAKKPLHNVGDYELHWTWHFMHELTPEQILPDNILIICKSGMFNHAAVCIAPDLFMSVYGMNGEIEFGSLADVHASYPGELLFLAVPR